MQGYWWPALAAWLLASGGCAARTGSGLDLDAPVNYLVISDALPNDYRVCVPLTPGTEKHQLSCMRLWEFRLFLRRNQQAD